MRWILVGIVALAVVVDLLTGITGGSLTLLSGLGLFYAGERLFSEDVVHMAFSGGGVVVVAIALAVRARRMMAAQGGRKTAETAAMVFGCIAAASILLYLPRTDAVVNGLGLTGDTADHWRVVFEVLAPLAALIGTIPMIVVDRALAAHPILLPMGATRRAVESGLAAALGLALVFPLNYLASQHKWDYDTSYFKVTDAGTSTLALVRGLDEPVEVFLFFDPGSDVAESMRSYFDTLESESQGRITVQFVDQAVDPKLSEDLKVRENGFVAMRRGDAIEKFKVGTDMDKAKRELKKLDENVQKYLLKIAKGPQNAYMMVGHGEASSKEKDDPLHKLNAYKQLLESKNFKIKNFGVVEGSADTVPDDAGLVIVAAPEKALLPEEEAALTAYLDRGGRLLVMVEPGKEPLTGLLGRLGLQAGTTPLANAKYFMPQTRGTSDRSNLVSNRFGTHEVTTTLSKNSSQAYVLMPNVAGLTEVPGTTGAKATVLIRSPDGTWADTDGDRELNNGEKSEQFNLAYAVTGPVSKPDAADPNAPTEWRAIVVGDVAAFSDPVLDVSVGNQQFVLDGTWWLIGEEDITGETSNEEDVKIEHTHDDDIAWFYGTIFGVPLIVLGVGALITTTRGRSK
jgi:hypothetical protein